MLETILDALVDALVDTAKLVPFLYVTYLAMEVLEHGTSGRTQEIVARAGKAGPIIGSVLGAVPQCGFSAMAATLFSGGVVSMGTLVAVILSTSDEMVPVFLANQSAIPTMVRLMLLKVIVGIVVGLTLDAVLPAMGKGESHEHIHDLCERAHCSCAGHATEGDDPGHAHGGSSVLASSARAALVHTAQTTLFILVISWALGLVVALVGTDAIAQALGRHPIRSVLLAGLVGLIPNCGASVALSQLYLDGSLGLGALVAGLLDAGGTGLLVLYRENRDVRQNLAITALLYVVGVACGLAISFSGVSF